MCPKGDDPLTPTTGYRQFSLRVAYLLGGSANAGSIRVHFDGMHISFPVSATSAECTAAFAALRTVATVQCTRTTTGLTTSWAHDVAFLVSLISFPVDPVQNNVYYHEGIPAMSEIKCVPIANSNNAIGNACRPQERSAADVLAPGAVLCYSAYHIYVCPYLTFLSLLRIRILLKSRRLRLLNRNLNCF
jgi:hypothetical protein